VKVRSVSIGEVAIINPKRPGHITDIGEQIPFIPMGAVHQDGSAPGEERRSLAEVITGYTYFEKGDVLLAKITPCFENGKAAHLVSLSHDFGFGSTEFHVLRAGPDIDSRYLYHAVRDPRFLRKGVSSMTGSAGQRRIPVAFVSSHQIPLPLLSAQRRVATMIDKADAIRRKREESSRLMDDLLRSKFLTMFGSPVNNEKGWIRLPMSDVGIIVTGNTPSRQYPEFYGDAIEWIKSDNINTPHHYITKAKEGLSEQGKALGRVVGPNSVLITCIAGSRKAIGKVALTDRAVAFNQQINAVVPFPSVDHRFLYTQLLLAQELIQQASTNSMKGMVSKSSLAAVRIMNPPTQLQIQFGDWFTRWYLAHSHMRRAAEVSESLFASLSAESFVATV
jgi:type I restriction enzyme, S subunit